MTVPFKRNKKLKEVEKEIEDIIESIETPVKTIIKETVIEKEVPEEEDVLTKSKREFNSSIARLNNYRSRYGRK
jgi:hypothetical protein